MFFLHISKVIIENNSSSNLEIFPYRLIKRINFPETINFFILHEGLISLLDDQLLEKKYDDLYDDCSANGNGKKLFCDQKSKGGWLGFTDKNWATVIIPPSDLIYQGRFTSLSNGNTYQVDYLGSAQDIKSGSIINIESMIFSGAKQVNILDKYEFIF